MERLVGWRSAACSSPALTDIGTRPIEAADHAFLRALYASTRAEELTATGWPPEAQERFLEQQFELQHHYYHEHFGDAEFVLLLRGDEPIGRLYWRDRGDPASLIDMALLPAERGKGIGSALLAGLTARADGQGRAIVLHVEPHNPALRLYLRFGFEVVADNGVYAKMQRRAKAAAIASLEETTS